MSAYKCSETISSILGVLGKPSWCAETKLRALVILTVCIRIYLGDDLWILLHKSWLQPHKYVILGFLRAINFSF